MYCFFPLFYIFLNAQIKPTELILKATSSTDLGLKNMRIENPEKKIHYIRSLNI